jgi:hypothetical protein
MRNPKRARRLAASGHLKRTFGITIDQYNALLETQNGGCAICHNPDPGRSTRGNEMRQFFCVDHDHSTGRLRGLLCGNCNTGLGHFRDSPELLAAAIDYLKHVTVVPRKWPHDLFDN